MSDLAVLSRIGEIQASIASLSSTPVVTAGPSTSGSSFASTLAAASAAGDGATGASTLGDASSGSLGAALGGLTGVGLATQGLAAAGIPPQSAATTGSAWSARTNGAADGDAVVADARRYLGTPYRWGGTDPSTGLDCSGLVQRVFSDLGVHLPRTVSQQKDVGRPVASMDDARPGDLLVFGNHHIGIYVGDGKMLHAPKTGDVVKVADVYATPTRIRRVLGAGDGSLAVREASVGGVARPSALRASTALGTAYDSLFAAATTRYGLPSGMLRAVAQAESGFDAGARSQAGAVGLMQLMPGTARELGVDPSVPSQAVDGAARLLRQHLDAFGSVPLALAAYNAGPGAVRTYGGVPPFGETQAYVRRVTETMKENR